MLFQSGCPEDLLSKPAFWVYHQRRRLDICREPQQNGVILRACQICLMIEHVGKVFEICVLRCSPIRKVKHYHRTPPHLLFHFSNRYDDIQHPPFEKNELLHCHTWSFLIFQRMKSEPVAAPLIELAGRTTEHWINEWFLPNCVV